MPIRPRLCECVKPSCVLLVLVSVFAMGARAQTAAVSGPNSDPTYQALRNMALGSESVTVTDFKFHRDAATFVLHTGTVCFVPPVNGKVTGAVFIGDGKFVLAPTQESERKSLKLLSKNDEAEFTEQFDRLVLRFTDNTYDEIKQGGKPSSAGCDAGPLKDSQYVTRHKIKRNLEARLLQEILSSSPRGYFVAFISGKRFESKELFEIETNHDSEQVRFISYNENHSGDWALFSFSQPPPPSSFGKPFSIEHHQIDATFEKSGHLDGKDTVTLISRRNGLRILPFDLFAPLRVQSVTVDGQPLAFIQEDKNDDSDFAVILPKAIDAGEKLTLTATYSGKDAVLNTGGGNYYPVARHNWYPNVTSAAFGSYALYDMTLRIPKGMKMAATGALVSQSDEGDQNVSVWKSEGPQTVAGFSFGRFKEEQAKLTNPEYLIQSFANEEPPDWVQSLQHTVNQDDFPIRDENRRYRYEAALGTMNTTGLNKKALAEGELAVQLYNDYFGPSQFKHMQLTQQTACNFGQSWPGLVWIPICYYFDISVRHQLSLDWRDKGYWRAVTPHEVAHQWWGHTVGFGTARDQWMSEGFADFSASLYLSFVEKDPKKFLTFWNDERELLLERDPQGFRAIDAGPLTMGFRVDNFRTGFGMYRRLVYPKGAYILQMLRMMMFDSRTADQHFKETMRDFVNTYRGKAATTEDFKAMIEKHMTPEMDLDGNHKMDWFFNEYVYGTQIPAYAVDSKIAGTPDGKFNLSIKITQSNVDSTFRMLVPVYIEMEDGRVMLLGRVRIFGTTPFQQTVPLGSPKVKPSRALINVYDDVLCSP